MILGAIDARGRAYDAAFASLRRRLLDGEGALELAPGESAVAAADLEATFSWLRGDRPTPLLLPARGRVQVTSHRLVFLADAENDRKEAPTRLNVEFSLPPQAVDHFFRQAGGREFLEVTRAEARGARRSKDHALLTIRARWPADSEEDFELRLSPTAQAEGILRHLARDKTV